MKKAIIYARVSSTGAQENRQNTERQVVSLTEYARINGYEVIKTFEEHISGGKKNAERTGLLECLNYAKENKGTTILVSELSRYGRQIWEVLESIKFCVDNGINVYFQKEGLELFDGDKVNGVMAIYISCLSFCAEKERENIAFRLAQGREMAIQKGVKMGRKSEASRPLTHYRTSTDTSLKPSSEVIQSAILRKFARSQPQRYNGLKRHFACNYLNEQRRI